MSKKNVETKTYRCFTDPPKKLFKTDIIRTVQKRRLRKIKSFAQHPIVKGKTQSQICPYLLLPFHELDFIFLVPYLNSYKNIQLDFIPRVKLGIWPKRQETLSSSKHNHPKPHQQGRLQIMEYVLCVGHFTHKPHFMLTAALIGILLLPPFYSRKS